MGLVRSLRTAVASLLGVTGVEYNATDRNRPINRNRTIRLRTSTANEAIAGNLPSLRARCRHLERNHPTARSGIEARTILRIGTGMDIMPDTGDKAVDDKIRAEWERWAAECGPNGESIYELQRIASREEDTVGESVSRLVYRDSVPLVLPLESEWIEDTAVTTMPQAGGVLVAGVTIDKLGRKLRYNIRNPETAFSQTVETVDAATIVHTYTVKRAMQVRGEPPLAPVIECLSQEEDLIAAELEAAKNTASMAMVITSEGSIGNDSDTTDETEDSAGDGVTNIPLGGVARLYPGESAESFSHTRPSQQIAPFSLFLRHRIAAALMVPVRYLDRDVGRANYSSSRTDMLDTEGMYGPDRQRFGNQHLGKIWAWVLPYLCTKAGIPLPPPEARRYRLVPDAVPYIDPQKDLKAATESVAANMSTMEYEVGKRGENWRHILDQRTIEAIETAKAEIDRITAIQIAVDMANEAHPGMNLTWQHVACGVDTDATMPPARPANQPDEAEPAPKQGADEDEELPEMPVDTPKRTATRRKASKRVPKQ